MRYTNIFCVALGAGIGSFATWFLIKERYERITNEEIDSVKKAFSRINPDNKKEENENIEILIDKNNFKNILNNEMYIDYSKASGDSSSEIDEGDDLMDEDTEYKNPYVISPDDFGELDGYDTISLLYTSDHILLDEDYEKVEEIESTVGLESLTHFGDYEDDSVFVRNERLKVDYEILLDRRKYTDIAKSIPYLMGDLDYDDDE